MTDAEIQDIKEKIAVKQKDCLGALSHKIPGVTALPGVEKPELKRTINSHLKKVYCVSWLEDSLHVITAGQEGTVLTTNASSKLITKVPVKCKFVMQCAGYKDLVACGGMQNLVEFHKYEGSTPVKQKDFEGHDGYISQLHFIKSGTELLSGSGDGTVRLWDLAKKTEKQCFNGHEQDVSGVAMSSPDSNLFATSSTDKTSRVWDMRCQYAVRQYKAKYPANCIAMMPNDSGIVAGCDNASWEYYDNGCGNQVARGKVKSGRCESVAISASGRFTYMGWDNGVLAICDTFIPDNQKIFANGEKLPGNKTAHTHAVCSLAVPPDGSALASSSFDCTAKIWGKTE